MDVRLLVAHTSAETKQIRLGAETLIGRGPECKLRISSGQVSRRHCLIKIADTSVSVRDLGSANGTRLNGQSIETDTDVPIRPGSTLVVGPLKFIVQFSEPRTADDEDTELLSVIAIAARSVSQEKQAMSTAQAADGEETKDYPPSKQRRRAAPPQVVVARDDVSMTPAPLPAADAEAASEDGCTTELDISIDPGETIFDVSLEDDADRSGFGALNLDERSHSEKASETQLLFEEDDLPPDDASSGTA